MPVIILNYKGEIGLIKKKNNM